MEVVKGPYPDPTQDDPRLVVVDVKPVCRFDRPVSLAEIKANSKFADFALVRAAKGQAFLDGRGYVTPQDVKSVCPDVLRHRILVTYEAEAEEVTSETIVGRILDAVPVP